MLLAESIETVYLSSLQNMHISSVVKSTDRDTIRYWNLKNVHFPLRFERCWAIINSADWSLFTSSTDTSVIGFNDHRFTLFTERFIDHWSQSQMYQRRLIIRSTALKS